ncbi:glycoside hydrolase family 47 protein [Suhomyces tanzawaensis NRRL Y-17324]|uniref:alpha-1,2-Mannosidase n=1 Tax=Suhomyces tanzawaensis NRRL Y-17324 TaxID=984487 RepID=A0A1E4SMM9_9ASCO|nr:glycoside hydrolase family 47 protein [Suhomyces tanzawaensis NRRL Y-17324]ODV80784.1 glycoside hydrolase family 47 protein [Suhomyces tanzawaensis NRRL Y-17324]
MYYKDKPSPKGRKQVLLMKTLLGSVVLYIIYYLASSGALERSSSSNWSKRQQEVKDVFLDSWHNYEKYGWGKDVYHPISETGKNMGPKPLGWMIVDSLDTLILMDAKDEVERARLWVVKDLDYGFDYEVNVFETTIRMLGGLLSAFHLTEDDVYLDKAVDLANALEGGFHSPTGLPYSSVNLYSGEGVKNHVDNGASSTAEVSTLQLEFKYLSKLTGETLYWKAAEKVMEILDANKPKDGLVPIYVHPDTGKYQGNLIRLGSRGDSYYEYLLKQYLQTNNQEQVYWDMYRESVEGVKKHMVGKSKPNGLTFIGELDNGIGGGLSPKMDHLVCFYGGLLALGATNGLTYEEAKRLPNWTPDKESDFKLAEELTYTCYKMYKDVATGLSPEIVVFNQAANSKEDFHIKPLDRHNLQRPETVESLFYLYRLTGDVKYREYGYEIFQSFLTHTKVVNDKGEVAYTSLDDVTKIPSTKKDNVESFWFAETLKYLYLLFDDENKIPLDKYVFNTEAHPFPRFDTNEFLKTGWRRKIDETEEPTMQPPAVKIDKQNPPKAKPADKAPEAEALEEVKKNPELVKDTKAELKKKLDKILQNME